jgi:hypothetical protein
VKGCVDVAEALRTYLNLINNLSEATRSWVTSAGRLLLAQAGLDEAAAEAGERVNKLADEIGNAGRANRQMLGNLVGAEVEQLVARLGFARTDEIDLLRDELIELRTRLAEAERAAAAAQAAGPESAAPRSARPTRAPGERAPRGTAKKTATTTPAKKAPAAKKSAARKAAAKRTAGPPDVGEAASPSPPLATDPE